MVFGGGFNSQQQLVKKAQASLEKFCLALQTSVSNPGVPYLQERQIWKKPPVAVVKVNWNLAIDKHNHKMGVGVIARDVEGLILASMYTTVPFITDPSVVEAVATWKAVVFCIEKGFQRIYLKGDALEIVQALRQEAPSWSQYGQLIEDTRVRLGSFHFWFLGYIRRDANEVAYCLAQAVVH